MTAKTPQPEIAIRNAKGEAVVRIALICDLYFEHGFDLEVRERIGRCFEEYRARYGSGLRLVGLPPEPRHPRRIDAARIQTFRDWLGGGKAAYDWYTHWHGGRNMQEASDYQFTVMAVDDESPDMSYMTMVAPVERASDGAGEFLAMCLAACSTLKPDSGYGGYGFVRSVDVGTMDQAEPLIYSLARRFPGAEVDPGGYRMYTREGVKGDNWLTVLGSRWIDRIGGLTALRGALGPEFVFHEYDGGLVIQAGARPQMGDSNRKIWPKLYPDLARVLKPIRITERGSFHTMGRNRFTRETSEAWLARYDKEPWANEGSFVEGATVVEAGVFQYDGLGETGPRVPESAAGKARPVGRARLVQAGRAVPMHLGVKFGVRCRIDGVPAGENVDARVELRHPPITHPATGATTTEDRWDWPVRLGVPAYTGWSFDEAWQMAPGVWSLRIAYGDRVLVEQSFDVIPVGG
jgi:hypothetical protein